MTAFVHPDGGTNKEIDDEDEDYQPFFFGAGQKVTITLDK
jgi:hypothetical protein